MDPMGNKNSATRLVDGNQSHHTSVWMVERTPGQFGFFLKKCRDVFKENMLSKNILKHRAHIQKARSVQEFCFWKWFLKRLNG